MRESKDRKVNELTKQITQNNIINHEISNLKTENNKEAKDFYFFTNDRRLWGDWDKIRKRILAIIENEDKKRINYLKRKLIQWKNNAREMTKEIYRYKIIKWIEHAFKLVNARKNWKYLSNKYEMFIKKNALFQFKSILRNWLILRDIDEKMRNRLTRVGFQQFKESI